MLSTNIAGTSLESAIINASGPLCTTYDELEALALSDSGAVVMKTCTMESRVGNDEPRYADLPYGSLQSMGLPNHGYKSYVRYSSGLKKHKPVIASIAGSSIKDFLRMMRAFQKSDVDMIEVNVSCPNVIGKKIWGFDIDALHALLQELGQIGQKPFGVKLPPYIVQHEMDKVASELLHSYARFITVCNSMPDTLVIDYKKECPVIKPKKGFGGLGGKYLKPVALANVRKFSERLGNAVQIIGVGGVDSGKDAFEYILAGADAVGVATAYGQEGPGIFKRVKDELESIMYDKGYKSVEDFKGNLKVFSCEW